MRSFHSGVAILLASTTACAGPWWGPSGDVTVEWSGGRCAASLVAKNRVARVTGWTATQPVGGLFCVFNDRHGTLLVAVELPHGQSVPAVGLYAARPWGAAAAQAPPGTFTLATKAFYSPRALRQLQSVSGELRITRWPPDGRDSSKVDATAQVHVRSGFAAP